MCDFLDLHQQILEPALRLCVQWQTVEALTEVLVKRSITIAHIYTQYASRVQCCAAQQAFADSPALEVIRQRLGLKASLHWLLLQPVQVLSTYQEVLQVLRRVCSSLEVGSLEAAAQHVALIAMWTNNAAHLAMLQAVPHLSPGCQPVVRPKRPVPYAAVPLVEAGLKRPEELGVLVPVSFSVWVAPVVVVKKPNGAICICTDVSTGLNVKLMPNCCPMSVPADLFILLNDGTCFARLDLADAYLQIEFVPESREMLTINTHRDLFQYTRLHFGVKTAPALFQQTTNAMFSGITGTAGYLNDIIPADFSDGAIIFPGCDVAIRYCRTTDFGQAGVLTRLICNHQEAGEDTVIAAVSIEDDMRRQPSNAIRGIPVAAAAIRCTAGQDPVLRPAITYVQTCWPTTAPTGDFHQLFLRRASLSGVGSYLKFADRVLWIKMLEGTSWRRLCHLAAIERRKERTDSEADTTGPDHLTHNATPKQIPKLQSGFRNRLNMI
ncbi:hypothetical protein SprV_0501911100 [Sparganum proliferum]